MGSAVAAGALVLVHYGLESARMAGELTGIWDLSLQQFVATSNTAVAAGVRLAGVVLVAVYLHGLARPRVLVSPHGGGEPRPLAAASRHGSPRLSVLAWAGATLVATSFATMGHTATHSHRWVLAALLLVHLLVIEFWFGALLPLILLTRSVPAIAARVIRRFSRIATALVPLIAVVGLALAYGLIPALKVLREPYGLLLLAKAAGFAVLMALASINKWMLGAALGSGNARTERNLRQSMSAEYFLIIAVLAITAVMTSFFSPEP